MGFSVFAVVIYYKQVNEIHSVTKKVSQRVIGSNILSSLIVCDSSFSNFVNQKRIHEIGRNKSKNFLSVSILLKVRRYVS